MNQVLHSELKNTMLKVKGSEMLVKKWFATRSLQETADPLT